MAALIAAVFVASLLGSLHCAGMCGGLVTVYAGADAGRGLARAPSHLAYNLGRLVTYAGLGAFAGAVGAALDLAGSLAGSQRVAVPLAGVLILLWGTASLLQVLGVRLPRAPLPPVVQRVLGRSMAAVVSRPPLVRAAAIGILTGFLPCGWLYAFVVTAAGTGRALPGALVMAVFWAGTLPVMAAVGFGVQALAGPLRRHVPALCAIFLMAIGLLTVLGRLHVRPVPPAPPGSVAQATAEARQLGTKTPPCCEKKQNGP